MQIIRQVQFDPTLASQVIQVRKNSSIMQTQVNSNGNAVVVVAQDEGSAAQNLTILSIQSGSNIPINSVMRIGSVFFNSIWYHIFADVSTPTNVLYYQFSP